MVAGLIRADGHPVYELEMGGNTDLSALPRLVQIIHKGRYDVVHTHLYRACVYGRVAARLAGVPVVVATEHSLGEERIEGRRLGARHRRPSGVAGTRTRTARRRRIHLVGPR